MLVNIKLLHWYEMVIPYPIIVWWLNMSMESHDASASSKSSSTRNIN